MLVQRVGSKSRRISFVANLLVWLPEILIAPIDPLVSRDLMINTPQVLPSLVHCRCIRDVSIVGSIRRYKKGKKILRSRIDPIRPDHVSWKLITSCGIEDGSRERTKITTLKSSWHCRFIQQLRIADDDSLKATEEEGLVFDNGTTKRAPEQVITHAWLRLSLVSEGVVRIKDVILIEFKRSPVESVRSRLRHYKHLAGVTTG